MNREGDRCGSGRRENEMKRVLELISEEVSKAFGACGYEERYGRVTLSNRPDLCEFQCNGAMAAAKEQHCAPFLIADKVAEALQGNAVFAEVQSVKPGFLNLKLDGAWLAAYLNVMQRDRERCGAQKSEEPKTVIVDYGGANVAKPLHVGHLRPAIIGECIKRMGRFMGHQVIGDVHLGDWGLQMGLIITELEERCPDLPYYDESYDGEYPKEPPFTIARLEEIYPAASARSKQDEDYKARAMRATLELQQGRRGYRALWQHIMAVSLADLKRNYDSLEVFFDLWKGESDADPYIPDMVKRMKEEGYAYISEGALVVDVKEETDTKEVPPCMILKSDGASLYNTTDLATLVWRMEQYHPDEVIYVTDKRQELYFTQVFRCARKTGIVGEGTQLAFIGHGTMNGKDGRPFKTRDGGVLRLEHLMKSVTDEMLSKIEESHAARGETEYDREEAGRTAAVTALAAVKYGDLSNQTGKDYIFDIERFTSFEGNTGPYLLYTIVRIKSILSRYRSQEDLEEEFVPANILAPVSEGEKALMLVLSRFSEAVENACQELVPHKLCAYIYELANAFNAFYHDTRILTEEDPERKQSYIALLVLTKRILEISIDILGFTAPERM